MKAPSTAVQRFATKEPTLCGVCRRQAISTGYAPRAGAPIMWLCGTAQCSNVAASVYKMPPATLEAYEIGAALEAGNEGGGYLDGIGKTDLATLDETEWHEFLRRVITGFEMSIRRKILDNEPPF